MDPGEAEKGDPMGASLADSLLWVVQIEGGDAARRPAEIAAALRRHPWVLLVPVVGPEQDPSLLVQLGALGVTRVLRWPGTDPPAGWRRKMIDVLGAGVGDMVRRQLADADPIVAECLAWSASVAHKSPKPDELSARLQRSPSALARHLRRYGGLAPSETLAFGRVIQAMYRLALTGQSVESVASSVGFASASGLRRAMERTVGGVPSLYRHRDGVVSQMTRIEGMLCAPREGSVH